MVSEGAMQAAKWKAVNQQPCPAVDPESSAQALKRAKWYELKKHEDREGNYFYFDLPLYIAYSVPIDVCNFRKITVS